MRAFRIRPAFVPIVLSAAALALSCSGREPPAEGNPTPGRTPDGRESAAAAFDVRYTECPNVASPHGDSAPAIHRATPPVHLAGPILHIAEYHDCQKLKIEGGRRFGPLVGVWARYQLDELGDASFDRAFGVPVAELYNFNTAAYRPLGIEPGYNCLYVRRDRPQVWSARMIARNRTDACPDTLSAEQWRTGHPLRVSRHEDPQDADMLPGAARWDYDERARMHYVGIRCGTAWCEVATMASPFASSKWYPRRPNEHIKGWYDEQWLAVPDGAGGLRPGPRARLVPVRDLDRLTLPDFECRGACNIHDAWRPVAFAQFEGPGAPEYVKKLNMHPGRVSTIELRYRQTSTGQQWQARIIAGPDTAYKKVERVDHSGRVVPGTARWLWKDNDELAWVRCALGCCSVTEEDV